MVAYLPLLAMLVLWFLVPESPRWLIATGRTAEAAEIIKKAAASNGKAVPEDMLNWHSDDAGNNGGQGTPLRHET